MRIDEKVEPKAETEENVIENQSLDPASFSLVNALADDLFYVSISAEHSELAARRRLAEHFSPIRLKRRAFWVAARTWMIRA